MKVSQLLSLALFAIVGSAIAQDEQVNCDAVCASKVEEAWTRANREINELIRSFRDASDRLDDANQVIVANDNVIEELREEIGELEQKIIALEKGSDEL